VADAVILRATGRRILRPVDFRAVAGGVRMRRSARRRFVEAYEWRMTQPFLSTAGTPLTLREALRGQALALAEAVRRGSTYGCFELP
jgi:CRISPR/Cas system-associated endonuclease Cas1